MFLYFLHPGRLKIDLCAASATHSHGLDMVMRLNCCTLKTSDPGIPFLSDPAIAYAPTFPTPTELVL